MNLFAYSEQYQNFLKLLHRSRKLIQKPFIENIMRIGVVTITLLGAASVQLLFALPAKSQPIDEVNVRIGLNNETLDQAFQKIEVQSSFHFMYGDEDVKSIYNLRVKTINQSVEEFLKTILAGTSLTYRQVNSQILIRATKYSNQNFATSLILGHKKLQDVPVANVIKGQVTNSKESL